MTNDKSPTLIPGFHGVRDTLAQGRVGIREIWIATGKKSGRVGEILQMAKERNIPVSFKKPAELSRLIPDVAHQGIVAVAEEFSYSELNQVIEASLQEGGHAILIVADHITDEGNLGGADQDSGVFRCAWSHYSRRPLSPGQCKGIQKIVRRFSSPTHSQGGKYREDLGPPEKKRVLGYRGHRESIHVHLPF